MITDDVMCEHNMEHYESPGYHHLQGPLDGRSASEGREERRVDVEGAKRGDVEELLGQEVPVGSRHAEAWPDGPQLTQERLMGEAIDVREASEAIAAVRTHPGYKGANSAGSARAVMTS